MSYKFETVGHSTCAHHVSGNCKFCTILEPPHLGLLLQDHELGKKGNVMPLPKVDFPVN